MIDLNAIMDALGARLETIGLRVHTHRPGTISPPAALVGYPEEVEYDATAARGCDSAVFTIYVFTGLVSERAARDSIAPYVAGSGERSIKELLEADQTLAGSCKALRVQSALIRTIDVAGVDFLAASFPTEVYA